jgi:pimeloyl-ACP methyl ester carboxylesterase
MSYDRRGRGESADLLPYRVEREIDDILALLDAAGGAAHLYGHSSGAVLALCAAAALGETLAPRLALYEPPFTVGDEARQGFAAYVAHVGELLGSGQRAAAISYFLGDMLPPAALAELRRSAEWPLLEGVTHTLAYESAVLGAGPLPLSEAQAATMPALVLNGAASPDFLRQACEATTAALPRAKRLTLQGQGHRAAPAVLAAALGGFFET